MIFEILLVLLIKRLTRSFHFFFFKFQTIGNVEEQNGQESKQTEEYFEFTHHYRYKLDLNFVETCVVESWMYDFVPLCVQDLVSNVFVCSVITKNKIKLEFFFFIAVCERKLFKRNSMEKRDTISV